MLGADDPLPHEPQRVLVAGLSGSGKTTLARRIGAAFAIPHTEIDALFHGPEWTPRPSFGTDIDNLIRQPRWVTEWQYSQARPRLAARADLLVWLDLPFPRALWQLSRRTVVRRIRSERLWNHNVEPPLHTFFTDDEHVIRYMIGTRRKLHTLVPEALAANPDLVGVRLANHRDVQRWLRKLPTQHPTDPHARRI